jgi:hypothetical protein
MYSAKTSLEAVALANIKKRYPLLERKGMLKTLRKLGLTSDFDSDFLGMCDCQPEPCECNSRPRVSRVIPDGWQFHEGELIIFEVEDTSRLKWEKLKVYCLMWDTFDCDVRLLSFDRLGLTETEVDLSSVWQSYCSNQPILPPHKYYFSPSQLESN